MNADVFLDGRASPFFATKPIVGMIHLGALPCSALYDGQLRPLIDRAVEDACALERGGVTAVMVENFFDSPFVKTGSPPITIAAMTAAALAIRAAISIPIGINVLRNDSCAALSIAEVCGAGFVRCNVFVGAMVTDQGIVEGAAREIMELRARLRSTVQVWADVAVKHAAPLGEYPIEEQAKDAVERGLADAIIVTGRSTGTVTPSERILAARAAVPNSPILAGSGMDESNAADLFPLVDGVIVGSSLKRDGRLSAPVSEERVRRFIAAARSGR